MQSIITLIIPVLQPHHPGPASEQDVIRRSRQVKMVSASTKPEETPVIDIVDTKVTVSRLGRIGESVISGGRTIKEQCCDILPKKDGKSEMGRGRSCSDPTEYKGKQFLNVFRPNGGGREEKKDTNESRPKQSIQVKSLGMPFLKKKNGLQDSTIISEKVSSSVEEEKEKITSVTISVVDSPSSDLDSD